MPKLEATQSDPLDLKAGEWVEVRTREDILATLDERGRLEGLPFMPEMLKFCGQGFRVFKRSDKTCQYTSGWSIRRMKDSVFLEGLRCDGAGHDGCQAGCLIFWKEAWLRRVESNVVSGEALRRAGSAVPATGPCTLENVWAASQTINSTREKIYSCQETDVLKFSSPMKMWDPRQYFRDLRSGNLASGLAEDSRAQRALDMMLGILRVLSAITISFFNEVQTKRHGTPYPYIAGTLEKTPFETLDLRPGEFVQVRSKEEIMATLDKQNRNRGLLFDWEMLTYCGGIYRVLRRVCRIIDDKTGRMLNMKYPCIVLEGVACRSDYHRLCPRNIHHYWRENWLKRVADIPSPLPAEQIADTCERSC